MAYQLEIVLMIILSTLVIAAITIGLVVFVKKYNQNMIFKEQEHENQVLSLKNDSLTDMVHKIESEKYRIAKDLHDEIGPLVSILRFTSSPSMFKSEKEYQQHLQILDSLASKVKDTCLDLAPSVLMKFGFETALAHFSNAANSSFNITFHAIDLLDKLEQPMSYKINLYRVLSELINNILKYGETENLDVIVAEQTDGLQIFLDYFGQGLNNEEFEANKEGSKGIGLISITERLNFLNASIDFSKTDMNCQLTIKL